MHSYDKQAEDQLDLSEYWPQPNAVPLIWYDCFNLDTIILQLFTPKLAILTQYDEKKYIIRMSRMPAVKMIPRGFIPYPNPNVPNPTDIAINLTDPTCQVESDGMEQAT